MSDRAPGRPSAARCGGKARALILAGLVVPTLASGLEPRYDHRDQQGPSAETFVARDFLWRGSSGVSSSFHQGVRLAWGFDPTGDGDEIFVGASLSTLRWGETGTGSDRIRWTVDSRYRVTLGTDELKTLLEVGVWGTGSDRVVVGPLVGLGLMYDFSRSFGLFGSAILSVGAGQDRAFSFGGGVGAQLRFE